MPATAALTGAVVTKNTCTVPAAMSSASTLHVSSARRRGYVQRVSTDKLGCNAQQAATKVGQLLP